MVSTGLSVWTISSQPGVRTLEVNPVRELDAANPHVQFDEREMETDLLFAGTAPSLDSTLAAGLFDCFGSVLLLAPPFTSYLTCLMGGPEYQGSSV
jgi:hypothetical protein